MGQVARPDAARRLTGLTGIVADYPISAMQVSYADAMLGGSKSLVQFWLNGRATGKSETCEIPGYLRPGLAPVVARLAE